jgi:peptidoglycan/xylan/chitin deacetylase (PgdA/CDA1 family)
MKNSRVTRKQQIIFSIILAVCILSLFAVGGIRIMLREKGYVNNETKSTVTASAPVANETTKSIAPSSKNSESNKQDALKTDLYNIDGLRKQIIAKADRLAASYDYDAAIKLLKNSSLLRNDNQAAKKIAEYQRTRESCVPVNLDEVTHIFYHSLVVDPERAFADQENNRVAVGNNQWMTTVNEFKQITEEMYKRGYVMVSIHDLVEKRTDEDGNESIKKGTILLPPGKKAFVLSLDDLSYYHSYESYGFASKMILDKEGNPTCEYVQADGSVVTGAYDVVPIIDQFVKQHPDASYQGAKGIIALTGYNGILGYRTDVSYETVPADINIDKKAWLEEHPQFNLKAERKKAKKIANAMKKGGWEFASHTWGHLKVGEISMENLMADTQKWRENVEPLVGATDTIIFAHGEDLEQWGAYNTENAKYQYLSGQGYRIYCNVDSRPYGTFFGDNYMRQSRRNLDGYRIYNNAIGKMDSVSDLFNAQTVIDPLRPPVHNLD